MAKDDESAKTIDMHLVTPLGILPHAAKTVKLFKQGFLSDQIDKIAWQSPHRLIPSDRPASTNSHATHVHHTHRAVRPLGYYIRDHINHHEQSQRDSGFRQWRT